MALKLVPTFIHECKTCTYLGSHVKPDTRRVELYHCKPVKGEESYVVRTSSMPTGYTSGDLMAAQNNPLIALALARKIRADNLAKLEQEGK